MLDKKAKNKLRRLDKRGVGGLDFLKYFAISLFVVVMVFFVLAVAGDNLMQTVDNDSTAYGLISNFTTAIASIGDSIPTWLMLVGLVVIVSILVVVIVVIQKASQASGGNGGQL